MSLRSVLPHGSRSVSARLLVLAAPLLAVPLLTGGAIPGPVASATPDGGDPSAVDPIVLGADDLLAGVGIAGEAEISLLTGDRVEVGFGPDGRPVVRDVDEAPRPGGQPVTVYTFVDGDAVYVVPDDALELIAADVLDWELFNVVKLAEFSASGSVDETPMVDEIPVIVSYAESAAARRHQSVAGVDTERELGSINADAARVATDGAWWQQVRAGTTDQAAQRQSARGRSVQPSVSDPLAGVEKVWLDEQLEITLADSVPMTGAPTAWGAGFDGSGVTVAVLDTGIDTNHADLAGKVIDEVDFTGNPAGVRDGHGHGTHVASTIAGTGAASGGQYTGVAPGAQLVIGKVCSDGGSCPTSSVIDGMEWAAESDAKVVNMSLGGAATDGTDPLSEALNQLSLEHGTLFVTSAGNSGPGAETVGAPGAADEALTVAAVDKAGEMADFSSRGPRFGDGAPKPDIAGPGVDIVAARASGTSLGTPVDRRYTAASGTSMSSPHVAGAAAIVAQQHPELDGRGLKSLLMSTAEDLGHDLYAQGAGLVDLARAVDPGIFSNGAVTFGRLEFPHEPVTRNVTYTNATDEPVTLTLGATLLASDGSPAPDGLLTLHADEVTVPAGDAAQVPVTLDGGMLGPDGRYGSYAGTVTATDPTGEIRAPARVSAFLEPERFDVTIELTVPDAATQVSYGALAILPVDEENAHVHDGPIAVPSPSQRFRVSQVADPVPFVQVLDADAPPTSGESQPLTLPKISQIDETTGYFGCQPEDFAGFTAGRVALVERGHCTFAAKYHNAVNAGATGVLLYDNVEPGSTNPSIRCQQALPPPCGGIDGIWSALIPQANGREIAGLLEASETITLDFSIIKQTVIRTQGFAGTYAVATTVTWLDTDGNQHQALPLAPEVTVSGPTTAKLDLRQAEQVTVEVPEPTETLDAAASYERVSETGEWALSATTTIGYTGGDPNWWMLPTEPVTEGSFNFSHQHVLSPRLASMEVLGKGDPLDLHPRYPSAGISTPTGAHAWIDPECDDPFDPRCLIGHGISVPIPRLDGVRAVPVVRAGGGLAEDLDRIDAEGALVLLTPTDICPDACDFLALRDRVIHAAEAGAIGVVVSGDTSRSDLLDGADRYDLNSVECEDGPESCPPIQQLWPIPVLGLPSAEADQLIERLGHRPLRIRYSSDADLPRAYTLAFSHEGQIPASLGQRLTPTDLYRVDHHLHSDRAGATVYGIEGSGFVWRRFTPTAQDLEWELGVPIVATQRILPVFVGPLDSEAIHQFQVSTREFASPFIPADEWSMEIQQYVFDDPSRRTDISWNARPSSVPAPALVPTTRSGFTPPVFTACAGCRHGDMLNPLMYLTTGSQHPTAVVGVANDNNLVWGLTGLVPGSCEPVGQPTWQETWTPDCEVHLYDEDGNELPQRLIPITGNPIAGRPLNSEGEEITQ